MSDDQRNDGMHPRHPGRGRAGCIELEAVDGSPEIGGFIVFLPSGRAKTVHWRSAQPITPTLDAAKEYCAKIVDGLLKESKGSPGHPDIQGINWTSMAAAVQRVILDWNDKLSGAVKAKMLRDAIEGKVLDIPAGADRRLH
jgi:hypothetical protein